MKDSQHNSPQTRHVDREAPHGEAHFQTAWELWILQGEPSPSDEEGEASNSSNQPINPHAYSNNIRKNKTYQVYQSP